MSAIQRFIVDRSGTVVHVIEQDEADTWQLLSEVGGQWPDCYMWAKFSWGWAYIDSNNVKMPWNNGIPPNSVILAAILGD